MVTIVLTIIIIKRNDYGGENLLWFLIRWFRLRCSCTHRLATVVYEHIILLYLRECDDDQLLQGWPTYSKTRYVLFFFFLIVTAKNFSKTKKNLINSIYYYVNLVYIKIIYCILYLNCFIIVSTVIYVVA